MKPSPLLRSTLIKRASLVPRKEEFVNTSKLQNAEWLIEKVLFGQYIPNSKYEYRLKQYKIDHLIYLDNLEYDVLFTDKTVLYEYIEILFNAYSEGKRLFICCKDGYDKSGLICGLLLKRIGYNDEDVFQKLTRNICSRQVSTGCLAPSNPSFVKIILDYKCMPELRI